MHPVLSHKRLFKNALLIKLFIAFYNAAINDKNFSAAEKYLGSRYTQHNPKVIDGPVCFKPYTQQPYTISTSHI